MHDFVKLLIVLLVFFYCYTFVHYSHSSQSIKIGIDLSIDKSMKIGKSDFTDIDSIDQSVEISDTLISSIDLS